jgi:hypothetical protein
VTEYDEAWIVELMAVELMAVVYPDEQQLDELPRKGFSKMGSINHRPRKLT